MPLAPLKVQLFLACLDQRPEEAVAQPLVQSEVLLEELLEVQEAVQRAEQLLAYQDQLGLVAVQLLV
mgnify:CR=1 FL=1